MLRLLRTLARTVRRRSAARGVWHCVRADGGGRRRQAAVPVVVERRSHDDVGQLLLWHAVRLSVSRARHARRVCSRRALLQLRARAGHRDAVTVDPGRAARNCCAGTLRWRGSGPLWAPAHAPGRGPDVRARLGKLRRNAGHPWAVEQPRAARASLALVDLWWADAYVERLCIYVRRARHLPRRNLAAERSRCRGSQLRHFDHAGHAV